MRIANTPRLICVREGTVSAWPRWPRWLGQVSYGCQQFSAMPVRLHADWQTTRVLAPAYIHGRSKTIINVILAQHLLLCKELFVSAPILSAPITVHVMCRWSCSSNYELAYLHLLCNCVIQRESLVNNLDIISDVFLLFHMIPAPAIARTPYGNNRLRPWLWSSRYTY